MSQMNHKVGIALAIYNPDIFFLKQQLQSLKEQTYKNWVCFISDDSNDEKKRIQINELLKGDLRFHYQVNSGTRGVLRNFENALKNLESMNCDYFCFCDQDDIWEPFKIEKLLNAFSFSPATHLIHSDLSLVDEKGFPIAPSCWAAEKRPLSQDQSILDLVIRNSVTGCTLMFTKFLLSKALPFPSDVTDEYLHDHWLAVVAQAHGGTLGLSEPLVRYRQHRNNVVGAAQQGSAKLSLKVKKMSQLKVKSEFAFRIRQKLATDALRRVSELEPDKGVVIEQLCEPILKPSPSFFFKGLLKTKGQWPEFGLWLQLFLGSLLMVTKIKK